MYEENSERSFVVDGRTRPHGLNVSAERRMPGDDHHTPSPSSEPGSHSGCLQRVRQHLLDGGWLLEPSSDTSLGDPPQGLRR
jgi:hypothetical protein